MPEARDRLSRSNAVDSETYMPRQMSTGSISVLQDNDSGERSYNQTPFRWGATPLTGGGSGQRTGETTFSTRTATRGGVSGRGLFGTPMTAYRRGSRNQNTPPPSGSGFRRGRGGRPGQHSVLPSWYPRTPFRDITHVVRAIERRRMHLGDGEGQVLGSPINYQLMHHQAASQDPSPLGVQLEHKASFVTPKPKIATKTLGKVPLILNVVTNTNQGEGDSELLTPQKKLLNSIDIVEKVVMEELNRLKRTPTAKKAEREKKVRTLMSMR